MDLTAHFYDDIRCGISNTFVDPDNKLEQKKARERMWNAQFRQNEPEKTRFYNRNRKNWESTIVPRAGKIWHGYYLRNKQALKEKKKQKYYEHHQKELERFEKYRTANRQKIREAAVRHYYQTREYILKRNKTDEVRIRRNAYKRKWTKANPDKIRKYNDTANRRCYNLIRVRVRDALEKYGVGKKYNSKAYGIDYLAIANKLGKRPGNKYHADHIIPASLFDLSDPIQIKLCFAPDNYQWMLGADNIRKGGRNHPETVAKFLPLLKQKLEGKP